MTPGTLVRLKNSVVAHCPDGRDDNRTARVRAHLTDIEGGLVLDRDLRGCRYWNITDLQRVANQYGDS